MVRYDGRSTGLERKVKSSDCDGCSQDRAFTLTSLKNRLVPEKWIVAAANVGYCFVGEKAEVAVLVFGLEE